MILVKINKTLTLDELEELVILTKMQETTDRYENTEIHIKRGKYVTYNKVRCHCSC